MQYKCIAEGTRIQNPPPARLEPGTSLEELLVAATGPEGLTGRLHLHTGSQHSDGSHKDVPANEKSAFLEYHRIGKVFDLKSNTTRHLPQLYSVELQRKQDSSIAYSS